jgi:hypothetical protein
MKMSIDGGKTKRKQTPKKDKLECGYLDKVVRRSKRFHGAQTLAHAAACNVPHQHRSFPPVHLREESAWLTIISGIVTNEAGAVLKSAGGADEGVVFAERGG